MDLFNASLGNYAHNGEEEVLLTLREYEENKQVLIGIIDRAKAAKRLAENEDFKMLVLDGYFKNEPHRLADLMASGLLNEKAMEGCINEMKAIGRFRSYMKMHISQGEMAENDLASLEEAREESLKIEAEAG